MVTSKNIQNESEEKKKLLKYGNGLNLVNIMPTKVRDNNWLLGELGGLDGLVDTKPTPTPTPTPIPIPNSISNGSNVNNSNEYVTHSSPFGFGFQFS